jgi:hypothetical protein
MLSRNTCIRLAAFIGVIAVVALLAMATWDRLIRAKARERENHFLAVQFLIQSYYSDYGKYPDKLEDAFESHGMEPNWLLGPFPNGLAYHSRNGRIELAEPKPGRISLRATDH